MLSRRDLFRVAGAAAVGPVLLGAAGAADPAGFTLPPLPYPADALEPHIDARTMELHHDKHHAAYVKNLNDALAGSPLLSKPVEQIVAHLEEVPEAVRMKVRNNAGGHFNHTFFWNIMAKDGGEPKGDLLRAIDDSFGSVDGFKKAFKAEALAQFGSGWAWLIPGKNKPLGILKAANQDNPLMLANGPLPILGVDVWEHAYYLKYQNKRADYLDAWMKVINWDAVAGHFADGKKG